MKLFRYVWKSAQLKIRNGKMTAFLLLMLMVSIDYNRPLRAFAQEAGYNASWCVFPFLISGFTFLILFWFGVIYVNSDIPFLQRSSMYQIIRTGQRNWVIGQIAGIGVRSAVLVVMTALCAAVPLLPYVSFSNDWGKLLYTASIAEVTAEKDLQYIIYYGTLAEFTPLRLMGLTLLITILAVFFMGVFMFSVCLYSNRTIAAALTTASTILLFWVLNTMPHIRYRLTFFVPAIWPQVARIHIPDRGYYWLPPVSYMLCFLTGGIILMSGLIWLRIRHMELNWENEDI